jgi:riboflavin synthase
MFTGIIEEVGSVRAVQRAGGLVRLRIRGPRVTRDAAYGDSIAVNGLCLTVADPGPDTGPGEFTADVIPETLNRSALGQLRRGDAVNLERAMRLGARLGGHLVQGHVHTTAKVLRRDRGAVQGDVLHAELPPGLAQVVAAKGSVAVDGVSLTVIAAGCGEFSVGLIPATLAGTTLGTLAPGDLVNLEPDPVATHVARCVERLIATGAPGQAAS